MTSVCLSCHNQNFIDEHFAEADNLVTLTNEYVVEGKKIIDSLTEENLLTNDYLDSSIKYLMFKLWRYDGRS